LFYELLSFFSRHFCFLLPDFTSWVVISFFFVLNFLLTWLDADFGLSKMLDSAQDNAITSMELTSQGAGSSTNAIITHRHHCFSPPPPPPLLSYQGGV
jgi:hypothetical protein